MTPDPPDWEGQIMLDRAGKRIGTIEDIYLVEETDRAEWAAVKLGRLRSRMTLVPLVGARPDADGVRATCDKATVEEAPRIDDEPSPQQVNQLYRHYGINYDENGEPVDTPAPDSASKLRSTTFGTSAQTAGRGARTGSVDTTAVAARR